MAENSGNQPNKPGGDLDEQGKARTAGDRRAVRNQSEVSPDDYPPGSDGKPDMPPSPD